MANRRFHQTSPVKRKALPRNSRYSGGFYDGASQDDALPMISFDDRLSWSLPDFPGYSHTDATYEPRERLDVPKPTHSQGHVADQQRVGSSHSSEVSPLPDRWEETVSSSNKSPFILQNELPGNKEAQILPRMWNPTWLRKTILFGFMLLFLALVAGLVILWRFAQIKDGIRTAITSNHYAWTYGPTALLVLIGVPWRQVDFHCRTLAPWSHLRRGPTSAKGSLLLDYVSPPLPMALVKAVANHDWAVLAGGMGLLLLRIVIVFSTGLLVLTPTYTSKILSDVIVSSKFVGTNYTIGPAVIDTELMQFYGIQQRGLNYQYGTSASVAYDTLHLQSLPANATVTAMVDGVFPFFNCEVVKPEIIGNNFTWSNDGGYPFGDKLDLRLTLSPAECPPLTTYYELCQAPECPVGRSIISEEVWSALSPPVDDLDPCANLYALTLIDINFEEVTGHPKNTSAAWNVTLSESVGIVCGSGYTVDKVNVTINTADPTSSGGVNASGPLQRIANVLPGYSYYNLSMALQNEITVNSLPPTPEAPDIHLFARLFAVLAGGSAVELLNVTTLKNTAEKAWKGVGVQLAHSYLRKNDNATTTASVLYQEPRLQVRELSVWAMSAGCMLLTLAAAAVLQWRPKDVVSRQPNSIGAQATILAASPTLQKSLETASSYSGVQSETHLQGLVAASHINSERASLEFSIKTSVQEGNERRLTDDSINHSWWESSSTKFWFMSAALGLPLAVIVVLEVLQHESNAHDGLVTISSSPIYHSLPSILASIILICIAIMYDAIDFATSTLAPYQVLARGSAPAKQTLLRTSSGNLPIWSTWKAIRGRHMEAAAASVAALIGSLLTIVASGLYTIEAVPAVLAVTAITSDKFVPSFGTSTDGSAGAIFTLIEQNNVSYPALTYDGLAFPNIQTSSLGAETLKQMSDSTHAVTLQANVVAMRASLNCTLVPRKNMIMTMYTNLSPEASTSCRSNNITFYADLPPSCPHFLDGENQTATNIPFTSIVQHTCEGQGGLAIHEQVVLNNQGATGIIDTDTTAGYTLGAASNPPGCPSLAFMSGYFVENVTSTENVTAMTCIQGLEEVHAETTFSISGGSYQITSEPKVDESSARWLQAFNSTYWFTGPNTFAEFNNREAPTLLVDFFYSQVNYGPDGIPADELTGPNNTQRFIDATQRMYRRYMAQLINATMRRSLNETEAASAPQYQGSITGISRMRLKQNATSKLILQIFLGIMLVCGAFVYGRRNMRRVLPHCPWSIAGTMSLLAGSEIIDRKIIPVGAEFMSDGELKRVFEGYVFSLGWWDDSDSTDRDGTSSPAGQKHKRFGIDIGKADANASAKA
ncbi:uncharacterized protein Z520_08470 [Fonsecaea multimorphosa CBS 102226]|uniref:Uncharacterized protein n=1 Tax=Fonsecaea multimorphosa CBS 102226 TaxID=1442371 RepID=A0A0D2JQX4_9EURO|nr:uncharacterized protein Z520_08470 [Fonsecaea multimorphosa CBS 102226]KIX95762.1 hypothetical protein Z520_08470 [Fonsecaea multimorphosa CBS 102226]OAL21499.1 hypothetical protein AYO22_07895 [Fonsecaea multimorphosa]